MAKRRKEKDEEEEVDFKLPKFDEEKFLKREKRNIKTTTLSFLFGVIIAVISFGFWTLLKGNDFRWELVLLFGLFSAAWIKYLFLRLNIDLTDFGRKGWFSSYAIYFFTWLLVFIIIVNPPFYDDELPRVEVVVLPGMQELGGTVNIVARITDNVGVDEQGIEFTLTDPDGNISSPDFTFENSIFTYMYNNSKNLTGKFNFKITVTDRSGIKNEDAGKGSFEYSDNAIYLALPDSGDFVRAAQDIKFGVGVDVSRVYYTVNDVEVNATKGTDYYETTPKQIGWPRGATNVTVKAYAEVIYYFENLNKQFNNTIVDTATYYFDVSDDSEIGTQTSPKIGLPSYTPIPVPGFEAILFIISLVIIVLIFKYRKKDKKK